jgi:hypothetical protein
MSGRVASDEDFSERPAFDVVAGGALKVAQVRRSI